MAFHWDRANRLLEQTQRRVYGSAARVLRRGGGGVKIFHWGVSPSKKFEHSYSTTPRLSLHVRSFESTGNYPSGVPPPSYEYYIHRTAPTYTRTQAIRALSVAEAPYFNITWQPGYLVIGTGHPY